MPGITLDKFILPFKGILQKPAEIVVWKALNIPCLGVEMIFLDIVPLVGTGRNSQSRSPTSSDIWNFRFPLIPVAPETDIAQNLCC